MTDEEFLKAFEDCTLTEFHHSDHIRMAWLYLRMYGFEEGTAHVVEGIRHFAASHQQHQLYHETITLFWIRVVEHVIVANPHTENFAAFFDSFPPLRDSKSIFRHYTKDLLMSEAARNE